MNKRRVNLKMLGPDRFSGIYLWVLFIAVFGIWKPGLFLTGDTAHSVASSQAVGAIMAIGLLMPLAAGAYDLSIGAVANLTAILSVQLQTNDHSGVVVAIAVSIAVSLAIGLINGFLVVRLRISSFIATLGMATIIGAVQTIITGDGQPYPPTSTTWGKLTQATFLGGFQVIILYVIVLAVAVWWFLDYTPGGRSIYAIGDNPEAARLTGVDVKKWTWVALTLSSMVCGIGGVLYGSLSGPSLTFGSSLLLPAFAAAFLGSTQIRPGTFNVWGSVIAVYVLATGVTGMEFVTSVQWLSDMFNGVALILAVAFAVWRQSRATAGPSADTWSRRIPTRWRRKPEEPDGDPTRDPVEGISADANGVQRTVAGRSPSVHAAAEPDRPDLE
jgi:ribose transport system permease protein